MAMTQPMGVGIDRPRTERAEEEQQKAVLREKEAVVRAGKLEMELRQNETLRILAQEMEETMLRAYRETPEGQAQIKLIERLKVSLNPTFVAQNQRRRLMGTKLTSILEETQAAP